MEVGIRKRIHGKSVRPWIVVTGAGSGIGREMAIAASGRGYNLVLCGRRDSALAQTADRIQEHDSEAGCVEIELDLVNEKSVTWVGRQIALLLTSSGGTLEGLIHCAGRGEPVPSMLSCHARELERCLAVNVTGPLLLTRLLVGGLRGADSGFLVFVGAGIDEKVQPGTGPYGISKMALKRMFQQLVVDMAHDPHPNDPQVTLIKPGIVDTPGLRDHLDRSRAYGLPHSDYLAECLQAGTAHKPDYVAGLVMDAVLAQGRLLHGQEVRIAELAELGLATTQKNKAPRGAEPARATSHNG